MIHRPKLERECNYNTLMKRYNELLEEEGMGLDWNLQLHCLNRQQLITKYYYAFIETDTILVFLDTTMATQLFPVADASLLLSSLSLPSPDSTDENTDQRTGIM